MTPTTSEAEPVEYIYTRPVGTQGECAHIIESHHDSTVETRCGLEYEKRVDFMNECTPDDLPEHLLCGNCERSLRAVLAAENAAEGVDTQ